MKVKEHIARYDATPYSLTELNGIAALDEDNDMSYDDMRMDYLKEKYSL